ncbi:hypothetical protein [Paraburkholderia sp. BL10I2N1]|uniref:hypothetical protein n=1 Tax=Paraburkholderia sp. BL10I2N1 TaxID=1938796 RepID=UPI00105D6362|nr:hypothetical protein [Paraburkholderia sp. BL10I2N1]TDN68013.1 hypothetical protein B0G77_1324 [Paraburkholderia sp. BL10I2N1]
MTTPLLERYKEALEGYIDAKDNTRPQRIADVFAPDAVLTFSLATANIAFPARTVGADAIAKTLVTDFALQYAQCRTYYVCDALEPQDGQIDALPWLVLMREPPKGALRVGHGLYRWTFAAGEEAHAVRVTDFHIHIARMDVVPDHDATLLASLQNGLTYPWLSPDALFEHFQALARKTPALAFIDAFAAPVTPLSVQA